MTQRLGRLEGDLSGRQPRAVHSALQMLEAVARLGPGATAKDLAQELGLSPATAYRLLNILVGEEYLVRLPDLSGFALGARVVNLGGAHSPAVSRAAKAVVTDIREHTRCAVHLASYTGHRIQVTDADPDNPPAPPKMYLRYPQAVALGKLMMAELDDWHTVVPGRMLRPVTDSTNSDDLLLQKELNRIRKDHFAIQIDELVMGRSCLALPIRDGQGELIAGLAASGSTASWGRRVDGLKRLLNDAVTRLSPLMS